MNELDGVRAVAILWVALFHYAVFWAPAGEGDPLLPYGDLLAGIPLAGVGSYGVMMFFVVSGAVIALSLKRLPTAARFGVARASRLVPAMLICSTLTFAATTLLGPPSLVRSVPEWLISATFVPPGYVGRVIGAEGWKWLDGAYWSLWTEVRFYAVAALIAYGLRAPMLPAWCIFAAVSAAVHVAGLAGIGPAESAARLLFAQHQPFFTAGIALAAMASRGTPLARAALAAAIAQAGLYLWAGSLGPSGLAELAALALSFALPALAILRPGALPGFGTGPLPVIGRASYGYYLLHQNLGLALLCTVPLAGWASVGWMLATQAALIGLAIVMHRHVEVPAARIGRPAKAA